MSQAKLAEQAVLGAITLDPRCFHRVAGIVAADDFAFPEHRILWELVAELIDKRSPVDVVTLGEIAEKRGIADDVGGVGYLIEVANNTPSAAQSEWYAAAVRDEAIRRRVREIGRMMCEIESKGAQAMDDAHALLGTLTARSVASSVTIKDALKDVYRRMEERFSGVELPVTPTPWAGMNALLGGGFGHGKLYIVGGRPGMGKEQPNSSLVLMADGAWKPMGEIRIGDCLASIDGEESFVCGVYPQGLKDVYEFCFSDGRTARAGLDHLWEVSYREWASPRIKSTREILSMLDRRRYKNRLSIRLISGKFGKESDLPLDPWFLGVLLGDGNFTQSTPRITSADDCIIDRIESLLPNGHKMQKCGKYDFRISGSVGVKNFLTAALRRLGLWGCYSHEKRIPYEYMMASREQRVELLRGLIDSDGWVESFGAIRFCVSSIDFAEDVRKLAMSIGCICSISEKKTSHRTTYVLNIRHSKPTGLCWLERKRERIRARRCELSLTIRSVKPVGIEESTCIQVSHPSRLYVTDDYVVTHNTAWMRGAAVTAAEHGQTCIISLEMDREEVGGMMLAGAARVSYQHVRDPQTLPDDDWSRISAGMMRLNDLPISICDMPGLSLPAITAEARRLHARQRLSIILIDYLGLIDLPDADRQDLAIGAVTRGLKRLARELNVPVVLLCQLSRKVEERTNKRPLLSDLRDAGQIEQDADGIVFLYRDRYYNRESRFGEIAEMNLAKQRGGRTGVVPVVFREEQIEFCDYAGEWPLPAPEQSTVRQLRGFRR